MKSVHSSSTPCRTPFDGSTSDLKYIKSVGVRDEKTQILYRELEHSLHGKVDYEPFCLNEFLPVDRRKRFRYLHEPGVQLPFDVWLYSYHPGGSTRAMWFVFKSGSGPDAQRANCVLQKLEKDMPVYHTRAMRRDFMSCFSLVARTSNTILNAMYRYLTQDMSTLPSKVSQKVHERLEECLKTQDPDLVYDLRVLNEGRESIYDPFWKEVDSLMNENAMKAVNDRRHGTICHTSLAMSVPDLISQVKSRVEAKAGEGSENPVEIPSEKWVLLQFMPNNRFSKSAIHYTGKLDLRFKVQCRQFNPHHPDGHYAAAIFKYVKEFAIRHKSDCVFACVDDKASIPIGEPGSPLGTVARGKQTVVQSGIPLLCSDHDTSTKMKVIPSTTLLVDVPEKVEESSFYRGQACTILKDHVFQPSSPLRHCAEIIHLLGLKGLLGKPIRIIYADGGGDHRVTFPSVQLALIALYLMDDCDVLIAARCCPSRSYTNPAERWHSVMNLALQSVALERSEMESPFESMMGRLNTLKEIRDFTQERPPLKEALMQSMEGPINQLKDLFQRLSLKGVQCLIGDPASEQLMEELWEMLTQLDNTISKDDTTSKSLKTKPNLQKFMDHCTIQRQYFFMVKKCGKFDCSICRPPRLQYEVHALPGIYILMSKFLYLTCTECDYFPTKLSFS